MNQREQDEIKGRQRFHRAQKAGMDAFQQAAHVRHTKLFADYRDLQRRSAQRQYQQWAVYTVL